MIATQACFDIGDEAAFQQHALNLFYFQAEQVPVYKAYLAAIHCTVKNVKHMNDIPFLPVSFFKSHDVFVTGKEVLMSFFSSGTSGQQTSTHRLADLLLYEKSFLKTFSLFYGAPQEYCIVALLPSYLEREGSSLVYMADRLIRESKHPDSGFYLQQYEQLAEVLQRQKQKGQKTILLGVSYALLDMAENFPLDFSDLIVMETGGMKGKRKELIREELHAILCKGFSVNSIHSEYGMTELLSQAYSSGAGRFKCPPWMKIRIREINDQFSFVKEGTVGGVCILDLANVYSCAFLAVDDLGKTYSDGTFEILGRFDTSELRGCNLMYF